MPSEYLYSPLAEDADFRPLVEMFVAEMHERVSNLLALAESHDWDTLLRSAHQLKGAGASYGFARITPAAARVEEAIRQGEPTEAVHQAVADLIALCRQTRGGERRDEG